MSDLVALIRRTAYEMMSTTPKPRHGVVKNVNPTNGTVRVAWDDSENLSGWLPVAQIAAGNGWSAVCLPAPETQVFCVPDTNDGGSMVVVGAVHSDRSPTGKVTPYKATDTVPITPGELVLQGPDGQFIRFPAGGGIQSRGTWIHDGDLKTSGQVTDLDGVHGSVDVLRQAYNGHRNTGVQPGGGVSGLTDNPTP